MNEHGTNNNEAITNHTRHITIIGGMLLVLLLVIINFLNTKTEGWLNWALIFFGLVLLFWIVRFIAIPLSAMGLERKHIKSGIKYGIIFGLCVVILLSLAYVIKPDLFVDSRYDQSIDNLLYLALVFIPLHTIIIEELLFRGAMLGYLLQNTTTNRAVLASSILFGLWHILPSLGLAESSRTISATLGSDYAAQITAVVGTVIVTFFAGVVFCLLRIKSKSIIAPMIAHWSINVTALVFAMLAN